MQRSSFRLLGTAAALLALAACGEEFNGDQVVADPSYFQNQRFDCNEATATPSCPPFACSVDVTGRVFDCSESCGINNASTVFEPPAGFDLCVPPFCTVSAENAAPDCEPGCSDDDTTEYVFEFRCP